MWVGFFLVSLLVLYLEILVTRIFSLMLWHNLAYLVISLALLGIGAAGVWDSMFKAEEGKLHLGRISFLASLSLFIVCRVIGRFDFQWGIKGIATLVIMSLLIFLPFFFMGFVLVRIFASRGFQIGTVYGVNLAASAAGVILGLVLLKPLGMPRALMLGCILLAAAGLFFRAGTGCFTKTAMVFWLLLCLCGFFGSWFKFTVTSTKSFGKFEHFWPDFQLDFSKWDPLGRVDAFTGSRALLKFADESIPYHGLTIDGAADTTLISFKDKLATTKFFRGSPYGQSFVLYRGEKRRALVIGVGGAPDVEAGLHFDFPQVVGVEVNGSVLEAVRKFLPEVANDPRVKLVKSDGRSYVARSRDSFDIIQISGVDTISALQWGAYIQAENYIHTVEAYKDYLEHLSGDGILSIGLIEMHPPRNMLRACVLLVAAMRELGIEHPEQKIILVQQAQYIQMLAARRSFTEDEVSGLLSSLQAYNLDTPVTFEFRYLFNQKVPQYFRYQPFQEPSDDGFDRYFRAVAQGRDEQFVRSYVFDVSPVRDDKPFFYKFYYWPFLSFVEGGLAGPVLWAQFFEALIFAVLFMLLPLLWLRRSQARGLWPRVWFFFFIGLGYMMVEIPLIQRFVLYLGHPTYAMSLVLCSLLVFSGMGAWLFQKFLPAKKWVIWVAVAGLLVLTLLGVWPLPAMLQGSLSYGLLVRAALTAGFAGAMGIFMGILFPAGISMLEEKRPGLIPWAWAVNTSASVAGSIIAVMIAMNFGFKNVSLAAGLCYLLAAVSCGWLQKE